MFKKRLLSLFLFMSPLLATGQELLPFVENFTKSEYAGDNQVWNVAQGKDNAMYFANHHYFLRYNGVKWERYSLPNKTIIRSVFVDGDRVYCGSYKEFGYWKRINGKMRYFSVSEGKDLFLGNADNEEIWKVFKHHGKIYFQSFNEIYTYDGKQVEKIKFPELISYCYLVDGQIYVATVRSGVYIMEDSRFTKIDSWPELEGNVVHGMEKRGEQLYIFTKNNGVFVGDKNGIKPWQSNFNSLIRNNVVIAAKFLDDTTVAVGTGLQGLYILNLKDGTFQNINRQNSLKNNAVLSLALDKENDLWLGLDNGISHVEVNSPVSVFTDNSGLLGSVYSLATTCEGFLFVTNHGIFTHKDESLSTIPNSQGQVWDIYKESDKFVIGHNDGTFIYKGSSLQWVNPVNGGWKFLKSDYDRVYFQANYSGIAVYRDINDLTKWKVLDSITKPVRNIAQNKPGELWAADNYRSLYRILYDKDFNVKRVENVSRMNKIESDFGVKLFNFRNEILFLIDNTWYVYNAITNKLEKDKDFNDAFSNISDIIPVDDDSFLVIKNGLLYLITQDKGRFLWKLLPEKYYQGRLIMENTRAFDNHGQLLINLDDGFMSYRASQRKIPSPKVVIEAFYLGNIVCEDTGINYNQSVEVHVIPEFFGYNRPELFYRFNGGRQLQPVKNGTITFNNLTSGTQKLEVYYNDGLKNIKIKEYEFYVNKPWYFSVWMILVYIAVILGVFYLYYKWNKVRYQEKIKLNDEELKHRKQILELEMEAESRLRHQEYEKHMLEMEVQNKASEVAGKSLSIAKHSEMIESIHDALENEATAEQLKTTIRKIIKINSISKNEWQSFEKNLFKSHEEFVDRLSKKYPSLTPKDIKLSIYLKMNLSSKEIAPLMNISFRGVELHRYRLRKKLGITPEDSLYKFMINI